MKSSVIKRSIVLAGHRTSVSVEDAFWEGLKTIAKQRHETLPQLVASIDADRQHANLSSAIRLYILDFYRDQHQRGVVLDPSITQSPSLIIKTRVVHLGSVEVCCDAASTSSEVGARRVTRRAP
jgi:predicted DNA-binding ribbon-helix-helix protein